MKLFENILGKGENAGKQVFSPFCHNIFCPTKNQVSSGVTCMPLSANAFNLDVSQILSFG